MLTVLGILFVALAAYWALLFMLQRSVMFPGPSAAPSPAPPFVEEIWLEIPSGEVEAWHLPADGEPRALILFAHGNGELIDYWPRQFAEPRSWGVSVLLVEYPGYGRSGGSPSRESVTATMLAAWEWAERELEIPPERFVGYGRSLGTAAVCALAAERRVGALVLESAFTSVASLASGYGLPSFLLRDPFDNRAVLADFEGPVLLLHGERDDIIAPENSRQLHEVAARSTLKILPCGHNDCPRPWDELREFLESHSLL